jgi:hypothetical protein
MSERRTIEGEVPDGIADRTQGNTYNPNSDDELAVQRARFNQQQQQIQHDREQTAEVLNEVQGHLGDQFVIAQQNPDRQAFVPEQQALAEGIEPASTGGQFDTSGTDMPETVGAGEWMRRVEQPTPPTPDALGDERP